MLKEQTALAPRPWRRVYQRFIRNESGSAVEFGLIAIPFLALFMAIFEVGLQIFAQQALENGTREAARIVRTGEARLANPQFTPETFKTNLCKTAGIVLPNCTTKVMMDVRRYKKFNAINFNPPARNGLGVIPTTYEASCPSEVVTVRVYYDWPIFTNLMALAEAQSGKITLSGIAVFRNEPFPFECPNPLP